MAGTATKKRCTAATTSSLDAVRSPTGDGRWQPAPLNVAENSQLYNPHATASVSQPKQCGLGLQHVKICRRRCQKIATRAPSVGGEATEGIKKNGKRNGQKCWMLGAKWEKQVAVCPHTLTPGLSFTKTTHTHWKEATTWPTVAAYELVKPPRSPKEFFFRCPTRSLPTKDDDDTPSLKTMTMSSWPTRRTQS